MNKIQIIAKETQATSLRKITISVEDLLSRIFLWNKILHL